MALLTGDDLEVSFTGVYVVSCEFSLFSTRRCHRIYLNRIYVKCCVYGIFVRLRNGVSSPEPCPPGDIMPVGIAGSPGQIATQQQSSNDPIADESKWSDDRKFLTWMSNSSAEIERSIRT